MSSDTISVLANLALALSFVVGLVFGIVQTMAAARDRKERITLEALRSFQTREFAELMIFVNAHDLPATYEHWRAAPVSDQVVLLQYAQEMESIGILVAEKLINLDLVEITLGSMVTTSWAKYKLAIEDMREKIPDPFLCEYFQWLAEQLDDRMRNKPREPYYLKN